jgi:hypothetical protein
MQKLLINSIKGDASFITGYEARNVKINNKASKLIKTKLEFKSNYNKSIMVKN